MVRVSPNVFCISIDINISKFIKNLIKLKPSKTVKIEDFEDIENQRFSNLRRKVARIENFHSL